MKVYHVIGPDSSHVAVLSERRTRLLYFGSAVTQGGSPKPWHRLPFIDVILVIVVVRLVCLRSSFSLEPQLSRSCLLRFDDQNRPDHSTLAVSPFDVTTRRSKIVGFTDLARLRCSQRFYEADSFFSGWCSVLITQFSVSRIHLVYRIGKTGQENHRLKYQLCLVYYIVCRYPFLWSQFV